MKEAILKRLRQGGHVSGEDLGRTIGISRTAIWKYIKELRHEGYHINSSTNKGYLLVSAPDSLFPEEIKDGLNTRVLGKKVIFHKEVTSTQDVAKSLASHGEDEGTVVVTEIQSGGRGRIGRIWSSPSGGIYFSIILRPNIRPTEALRLPLVAGIAVARAIASLTELNPKLKWPNDIIINDRKAGGILTEMSAEVDRLDWIIIGIGLNVNTPPESFPSDIEDISISLMRAQGEYIHRVKLLQHILQELEVLLDEFRQSGFEPLRLQWKGFSNTIGETVKVTSGSEEISGQAIDIDSDGALILQKNDGTKERIIAGDIRLRKASNG